MTTAYGSWPAAARTLARAIDAAVSAARAGAAEEFSEATGELGRLDREQLAVLLGFVARELIERQYPDGLDSEGAEEILDRTARSAASWYPDFSADTLVPALTGALGVSLPDEEPARVDGAAVVNHGLLLIADLLDAGGQRLAPVLEAALRELQREQTVELP